MMTLRGGGTHSFARLTPLIIAIGACCLAGITVASPGATRMWSWPWTLVLAATLAAPVVALIVRAFDSQVPLHLPARGWRLLAATFALVTIASALASPHRPPSVLWSASLLAGAALFFITVDWLGCSPDTRAVRQRRLEWWILLFLAGTALASMSIWLSQVAGRFATALDARNPYPLGHPSYTAGLALLTLPIATVFAVRDTGAKRAVGIAATALAVAMLFTCGSRGGLLGVGALVVAALFLAPFDGRRRWQLALVLAVGALAFVVSHPRTRSLLAGKTPDSALAASDVQRAAMLSGGWQMGADRPVFGWGPGTTPLVFPRYRAKLEGGAENVLQLHSTPVHLWAELGAAGVICLLGFAALVGRDRRHHRVAAATLVGYGVFLLTDWQLDVPVFAATVAVFSALIAAPSARPAAGAAAKLVGVGSAVVAAIVVLLGHRDPLPELNVRALALARDPARTGEAIALLRDSLTRDPAQEIAQFNLGWLLVVDQPAQAEQHFRAAAALVPDKGGVYFGLGLSRLNQGHVNDAARAFALECVNDPAFLVSPWWREPAIAATRDAAAAVFNDCLQRLAPRVATDNLAAQQLAVVRARADTLGRPAPGPERVYRRERTGYPILMRNLDLAPPLDLYDVREPATAPTDLPPKGWLPSPLLLALLDEIVSARP